MKPVSDSGSDKNEVSNETPVGSATQVEQIGAEGATSSIGTRVASIAAFIAALAMIFFVALTNRTLNNHLEFTFDRFAWDTDDFLLVFAIPIAGISLVLSNGKKIRLIQHMFVLLLFGAIVGFAVLAKAPASSGRSDTYAICASSLVGIEVLALIIRFIPQVIGSVLVFIGLTFPFGLFGLIKFDGYWKRHTTNRIAVGLIMAAIGIVVLFVKNKKVQKAVENGITTIARGTITRKIISVPVLVILVISLAWFTILRSLFAPVPVDGRWQGKGGDGILGIEFTVEGGGRFVTDVAVAFGPQGSSAWSIQNFPGRYEIKGGKFTLTDNRRSNSARSPASFAKIHAVFSSTTEVSGYAEVEESISETTYTREGPRGIVMPHYYSGTSIKEGTWTARIESLGSPANGDTSSAMFDVLPDVKKAHENPNDYDLQVRAAKFLLQMGRYDQAIRFLMPANQLRPDTYELLAQLGDANREAGHFTEAERWFATALQKQPNDAKVRTKLGLTFLLRERPDLDRAIQEFHSSLKDNLEPNSDHVETLCLLSLAYARKGDKAQAQTTLAKVEKIAPYGNCSPDLRLELEKLGVTAK